MTREERELSIIYLEGIKEEYIEGEGYERHPLPEYYAIETAIKVLGQEPCEDAISRQAVLALAKEECDTAIIPYRKFVKDVNALPPVTPQPKMGRWISFGIKGEIDGQIVRTFTCSECGAISIFRVTNGNIVNGDLCPNCGAKMQEEKTDVQ